uniref:Methyltransf_21 domain-containing protein n=1 Tax=Syphacia muris TaxID=451379 RepID=A0A0N5AXM2_9BILA
MDFSKVLKPLEALATECALENLHEKWLIFAIDVVKGLRKHPQNIVVEYAAGWNSSHFAVYGFIGTQINLMLNFNKIEMFLEFFRAAQQWNANWVLHESMNFVPIMASVSQHTEEINSKFERMQGRNSAQTIPLEPNKLKCFICDEQLADPNQHLRAVKCDMLNLGVQLWAHC